MNIAKTKDDLWLALTPTQDMPQTLCRYSGRWVADIKVRMYNQLGRLTTKTIRFERVKCDIWYEWVHRLPDGSALRLSHNKHHWFASMYFGRKGKRGADWELSAFSPSEAILIFYKEAQRRYLESSRILAQIRSMMGWG